MKSNTLRIEDNQSIEEIFREYLPEGSIVIRNCISLEEISIAKSDIERIEVISCPALWSISIIECEKINEENFLVENCPRVTHLNLLSNSFKNFNASVFFGLESLEIGRNHLDKLNVRSLPFLLKIDCSGNELMELDCSNLEKLEELNCSENKKLDNYEQEFSQTLSLKRLNLKGCVNLRKLFANRNNLEKLDFRDLKKLEEVEIKGNGTVTFFKKTFNDGESSWKKISSQIDNTKLILPKNSVSTDKFSIRSISLGGSNIELNYEYLDERVKIYYNLNLLERNHLFYELDFYNNECLLNSIIRSLGLEQNDQYFTIAQFKQVHPKLAENHRKIISLIRSWENLLVILICALKSKNDKEKIALWTDTEKNCNLFVSTFASCLLDWIKEEIKAIEKDSKQYYYDLVEQVTQL